MFLPTRIRIFAIAQCLVLAIVIGRSVAAQPVNQVPEGLSATQYFELGKQYKAAGWPEQARDALTRSIKGDPQGIGKKTQIYLSAYVPRYSVSNAAVQKNVTGYNEMARGDQASAIRSFQECIQQFPNFEWPYGNLGSIYTQQGRTKEAKEILQKALTINPSYVNGWIHMAEANLRDGDVKAARHAAQMALQLDPDNALAKFLLQRITAQQEAVPTSNELDTAPRDEPRSGSNPRSPSYLSAFR